MKVTNHTVLRMFGFYPERERAWAEMPLSLWCWCLWRTIKRNTRDWWRGYSDKDADSAYGKMDGGRSPGKITFLTERELKAWTSNTPKSHR